VELRLHWNSRKYGPGKLGFPHAKEYLLKCSTIWARAVKTFVGLLCGRKSLRNIGFSELQIINLPGAPTCFGPALLMSSSSSSRPFYLYFNKTPETVPTQHMVNLVGWHSFVLLGVGCSFPTSLCVIRLHFSHDRLN